MGVATAVAMGIPVIGSPVAITIDPVATTGEPIATTVGTPPGEAGVGCAISTAPIDKTTLLSLSAAAARVAVVPPGRGTDASAVGR